VLDEVERTDLHLIVALVVLKLLVFILSVEYKQVQAEALHRQVLQPLLFVGRQVPEVQLFHNHSKDELELRLVLLDFG
jgi:hypothetical protein